MAKALSLEKAYFSEQVPSEGAFIVSGFFPDDTAYAVFEVTAYRSVKDIFKTTDGIIFKTDGNRISMMVEPATYPKKYVEPVNREADRSIPFRFNELDIYTCYKSEKIMVSKEPSFLYSSFTILDHGKTGFSYIFIPTRDVYTAIRQFITESLSSDCNLSRNDAAKGADMVLTGIKKFSIWKA